MNRIFLLSPARCSGKRAALLLNEGARFPLALRIRSREGAYLGEVFSFMSGLYFRGKLEYTAAFARPPEGIPPALVITPNRGLVSATEKIRLGDLRKFVTVDIHPDEPRFRSPLERDARKLARSLDMNCQVVLLGSIATAKYLEVLSPAFSSRLLFPAEFVGRGDMSRGGLMLRCARENRQLTYVPLEGAIRHGPRPPRLERIR